MTIIISDRSIANRINLNSSIQVETVDFLHKKQHQFNTSFIRQEKYQSDNYLITSSRFGLESYLEQSKNLNIRYKGFLIVGQRSAELITNQQDQIKIVTNNLQELAQVIAEKIINNQLDPNSNFIRVVGNLNFSLKDELKKYGIKLHIQEVQSYQTYILFPKLEIHSAVILTSPSMSQSYLKYNSDNICQVTAFCIGNTTANLIKDQPFHKILIAEQPTVESIQTLINNHYEQN